MASVARVALLVDVNGPVSTRFPADPTRSRRGASMVPFVEGGAEQSTKVCEAGAAGKDSGILAIADLLLLGPSVQLRGGLWLSMTSACHTD